MLAKYLITDDAGTDYGLLTYDPETRSWKITINPSRTWNDTPLSLAIYIKNGIYSLDEKQSLSWVRERLLPPNRQNIHHILREMNISEYDEFAFIRRTRGTSPNDGLFLMEK